jgi:hypothetical protein
MYIEAENHKVLVQHGVLPSLAGEEWSAAGVIYTVMDGSCPCPDGWYRLHWQVLLSCKILVSY